MSTLIGKKTPSFKAKAIVDGKIVPNFSLEQYQGQYVIFFFYPLDFTFVCPTELHAFQDQLSEFANRQCKIVGCSVDSAYTHLAWLNTPKSKGGISGYFVSVSVRPEQDDRKGFWRTPCRRGNCF